jgi:hypothetical protein
MLNRTVTGPVQDNPNCAPPQLAAQLGEAFCVFDGEEMRLGTGVTELLVIILRGGCSEFVVWCGWGMWLMKLAALRAVDCNMYLLLWDFTCMNFVLKGYSVLPITLLDMVVCCWESVHK